MIPKIKILTISLAVLLGLAFCSCIDEEPIRNDFETFAPLDIGDGWTLSTPSAENVDSLSLANLYKEFHVLEDFWMARSLSVFRNGKAIAESYSKDESDRYTPRAIWSCTKPIVGLLTGIAMDKGLISSPNDSLYKYLPDECLIYKDKSDIKIKHLLTMSSGIKFDNSGYCSSSPLEFQEIPDSYIDFIFEFPMESAPGKLYSYKNSDPTLLSHIIAKQSGISTDIWANNNLFSQINFKNYIWKRYKDGTTLGGYGILATPRELAKIAELMINRGKIYSKQIVPGAWIDSMETRAWGQLWKYNDDIYYLSGSGGQLAIYSKSKKMSVVIMSEENIQWNYMLKTNFALEFANRIFQTAK